MYEVIVRESEGDCLGLVVLLPGRGQPARDILARYHRFSTLNQFTLIAVEPMDEWYPVPKGSQDQTEAVWGLKLSVPQMDDFIAELEEEFEVDRSNVILGGFSAGAVMAIQLAALTDNPFNSVIAHNGAILEPDELPKSRHSTKYLVLHNENDDCFSWKERYLPMKNALVNQGYDLEVIESEVGGHYIAPEDVEEAGFWIREQYDLPIPDRTDYSSQETF
jgi:phospholipase/carboxylesterase